jgi:hypothetical protein
LSRDKLILILFVFIWIGIIAYNSGFFETARVVPVGKTPVRPTAALPSALEDLPELRLDLLDSPRPPYKGIKKNIFSPLKFPVPEPPKEEPVAEPVLEPPPVVKPPPSPLETFKASITFIGFLEKEKDKTVFLTRGEDVFLVKRGDIIEGRFRVAEITDTVLRFSDELSGEAASIGLESE